GQLASDPACFLHRSLRNQFVFCTNHRGTSMSIENKVALITSAGQGIGQAIALRLADDGADVAIVDINKEKMQSVAREAQALSRKAATFKANVSKRDQVYAAVDHAEKELGGFDIIVNNAS